MVQPYAARESGTTKMSRVPPFLMFMNGWPPQAVAAVVAAVIALFGVALSSFLTWRAARTKLRLDRRVETVKVFLEVSKRAQSRPEHPWGGHKDVGETMAAMYLLADLAHRDRWLRPAGREQLHQELDWLKANQWTAKEHYDEIHAKFNELCSAPRAPQPEIDEAYARAEAASHDYETWDRLIRAAGDARAKIKTTRHERRDYRRREKKNKKLLQHKPLAELVPLPPSVRNSSTF